MPVGAGVAGLASKVPLPAQLAGSHALAAANPQSRTAKQLRSGVTPCCAAGGFEAGRLLHLVGRATETDRLRRENATLRERAGQDDQLNGSSVAMNTVRATLKRVAPTGSRVMISGPGGVGKEIAARTIAYSAAWRCAPDIMVSSRLWMMASASRSL